MARADDPASFLPMSVPVFHILLSLADGERHGWGILLEVERRTDGEVRLGTSTLYTALRRLLGAGLVAEAPTPPGEDDPRRQRHYALTPLGREALRAEAGRMRALLRQAQLKDVLPEPAS